MKPASRLVAAVSVAAVVLALGLFTFGGKSWQRLLVNEELIVAVAEVKLELRPVVLRISGELQPAAEVKVVSRLAGRLTEVKFKNGDRVAAGAVVASVYSGELAERVRLVEAELNASRKQLLEREKQAAAADNQFLRHQELYRQDLIARREMEQAEIQAATSRAQRDLVRAQIAQEEAMLSQILKLQQLARIVAPVSGVVTGALSSGVFVNETRPILTIAQVDALKLTGAVPARYAGRVREGMSAQISPRQGAVKARAAKVVRLDSDAKSAGAELEIDIRVDNRDRALQPGAAADGILIWDGQEHKLTIPRAALQSTGDQHYVFQVADGRALRRVVELEDASTDPVVIRHGLKAGDQVIVDRLGEIKDGLPVHPAAQIRSP